MGFFMVVLLRTLKYANVNFEYKKEKSIWLFKNVTVIQHLVSIIKKLYWREEELCEETWTIFLLSKVQSVSLGHRTNMTETKALTTDTHNCHLSLANRKSTPQIPEEGYWRKGKQLLTARNCPDTLWRPWCC